MKQTVKYLLTPLLVAGVLAGCASPPPPGPAGGPYQTVGKEPHRDTSVAARETDLAMTLMAKNDYTGAEAALKRALAADVMYGPAHNNLGLVYFEHSQLYLAAWEFQYAVMLMPGQPAAKNNLGLVFETTGKLDQAVDAYDKAMKLEPDNPEFVGNLARARVRRGDADAAVRDLLARVIEIDTRSEWVDWVRERLALLKNPKPN